MIRTAATKPAPIDLDRGGKTIFVISPQPWKGFKVSKHHYAALLAEGGHRVFFFDPPQTTGSFGRIDISDTETPNLRRVAYRPFFPYGLKFRFRPVFDRLMRYQARRLVSAVGVTPDLVWDFDNAFQFADLSAFGASATIFHPVDSFASAAHSKNADVVLSVSPLFIARAGADPARAHVIPHGLGPDYAAYGRQRLLDANEGVGTRRLRAGYVGNLGHVGVDWPTILTVVQENPQVDFVFFGPFNPAAPPIKALLAQANCDLRGTQPASEILRETKDIDLWMICYDRALTVDGGINSHKILEYLATGKPVIASRIDSYEGSPFVTMCDDDGNADFPALFRDLIASLADGKEDANRDARIRFALDHEYPLHMETITRIVRTHSSGSPR